VNARFLTVASFFGSFAFDGVKELPKADDYRQAIAFVCHAVTFLSALGIIVMLAAAGLHQQSFTKIGADMNAAAVTSRPRKHNKEDADRALVRRVHEFRFIVIMLSTLLVLLLVSGFAAFMARAWMTYVGDDVSSGSDRHKLEGTVPRGLYYATLTILSLSLIMLLTAWMYFATAFAPIISAAKWGGQLFAPLVPHCSWLRRG
jgi:lysylphosphatidylglycerol synthetase-like protein (DUF2156 family)